MRRSFLCLVCVSLCLCIWNLAEATTFTYTADTLPWDNGWLKEYGDPNYANLTTDGERNVLHVNDSGGSFLFASRSWEVVPANWYNTATFVLRNVDCMEYSGSLGTYFGIQALHSDGSEYHTFYAVYKDRIHPFRNEAPDYMFDTRAGYNTYTIVLHEGISSLYINGKLAFSHDAINTRHDFARNGVEFGAGSSSATGEAYWDYVSANQTPTDPIPEPSTILLLTTGLGGMTAYGLRRRKKV